nr:MAG TPA: hypothetical protein [Caudoviricetes sp.]
MLIFIVFGCYFLKKNLLEMKSRPDKMAKKTKNFFLLRIALILTC